MPRGHSYRETLVAAFLSICLITLCLFPESAVASNLTPDDLAHGERQLRRMLKDRPAMRQSVSEGDAIWQWTVRQFAGEGLGSRISWGGSPPHSDAYKSMPACSNYFRGEGIANICVRENRKNQISSEQLWNDAVFELHNIRNGPKFADLDIQVAKRQITEEQYIRSVAQLEYKADHATRDFYWSTWFPHACKRLMASNGHIWRVDRLQSFDDWFSHEKKHKTPYYRFYVDAYKKIQQSPVDTVIKQNEKPGPPRREADDSSVLRNK